MLMRKCIGSLLFLLPTALLADDLTGSTNTTAAQAYVVSSSGSKTSAGLPVGNVLRTNEMQAWFLSEHLVDASLAR